MALRKTQHYHHCALLPKHKLLSWDNSIKNTEVCLFYIIIDGLSSPPLNQFVQIRTSSQRVTWGSVRGEGIISLRRSALSQSAFRVTVRNETLSHNVGQCFISNFYREASTFNLFKKHIRNGFLSQQTCSH